MKELKTTELHLPLQPGALESLKNVDLVYLTGTVYTARDAAHRRIAALLAEGKEPPFPLDGAAVYYCGPSPAKPGEIIGSCGPTSSARMDSLTLPLLERGLKIMIGKGNRSAEAATQTEQRGAIYLKAVGGAAAYYKQFVKSCRVIAFPDLGPEAVRELHVEKMPLLTEHASADFVTSG
ncbi:MAG: fumarate hydratase C-terminal domain-containing protein [Clostridiales bacterium]|jgi:fumarate hydratase subunit beta|nr:fumarate hydratase C-terminal domain-containing protein [Clostridiales bacterium]